MSHLIQALFWSLARWLLRLRYRVRVVGLQELRELPFHSFGLTGNVVAPILAGLRVVHRPDPTDATGLVRTIADYRTSLLVTTPTFLSYMLGVASPEDLRTLRVIISGVEKCWHQASRRSTLQGMASTPRKPTLS